MMKNKRLFTHLLGFAVSVSLLTNCVLGVSASVDPLKNIKNESEESDEQLSLMDKQWQVIEVGTVDELMAVAHECSLDTWSKDKYVKLIDDIHLAGIDFSCFPAFCGVFDGNGHTIDGLIIKSNQSYLGLFSKVMPGALIENLTVAGSIIPGDKQLVVGGIAGDNYGTIENCVFEGVVEGNDYTGGIAGYNESTGIIIGCKSYGSVSGLHYTGGIVGTNCGGVYRCNNNAEVNTTNIDKGMSIEDININQYIDGISDITGNTSNNKKLDTARNAIDAGGVAGRSTGVIEFCTNYGPVGYEHVGYNIGGIVGRQSGYVHSCQNEGTILGRKDVGGIVGQAEPYIQIDLTEDIVYQLTDNINILHDLIDTTLDDSNDSTDTFSNRLTLVQQFVNGALNDTGYLADGTIDFVNGLTGAGNEALIRADYAMDEAAKDGGAIDDTKAAMDEVTKAADELDKAAKAANVYDRMTPADKAAYDEAKENLDKATEQYNSYYNEAYDYNYYYHLNDKSQNAESTKSYYNKHQTSDNKLIFYDNADSEVLELPTSVAESKGATHTTDITSVKHRDGRAFPDTEGDHAECDAALISDARTAARTSTKAYANDVYKKDEGPYHTATYSTYSEDTLKYTKDMSEIMAPYASDATDEGSEYLSNAAKNLERAGSNLSSATGKADGIFRNLNGRDDITLPSLGSGYRSHADSFVSNLQGMSDNLGFLNNEMNSASDVLTDDMQQVNDQFNTVMLLFTDALDGALDGDYSDVYEDGSFEVARECTDGTIADCLNIGRVEADLDVSGIAGTMAIEYEFDMEGDVTGASDSRLNSTYMTKCVLRSNVNKGRIIAQKSYVAGVTGIQELGTVLNCENYGRIISNNGDYVGGIAGSSVAYICESYSRGVMSGGDYIGGIAGWGHNIYDSYAIPSIVDSNSFIGAIAGEVDDESDLRSNYFVSDNLAGIDRISYSGLAEPIDCQELGNLDMLPDKFCDMSVTFLVDEKVIETIAVPYGGSLDESRYPSSVTEADYYIDWDTNAVHDLTTDMEVIGEPALYRTSLASTQLRGGKQSVLLVDGKFKASQVLETRQYTDSSLPFSRVSECWELSVPEDTLTVHQVRLKLPYEVKKAEIYVGYGDDYVLAETTDMGMYKLFTISENRVNIIIVDKTIKPYVYIIIGAVIIVILAVAITVIIRNRKKKNPKQNVSKKDEIKKKAKKSRENRKELIGNGIEKVSQLIEEAKDDSPRGEK